MDRQPHLRDPLLPLPAHELLAAQKEAILNAVGDKLPGSDREPVELVTTRSLAARGLVSSSRSRRSNRPRNM